MKLHKIIFLMAIFVFYCFFKMNKDLAIYTPSDSLSQFIKVVDVGGGVLPFNKQ